MGNRPEVEVRAMPTFKTRLIHLEELVSELHPTLPRRRLALRGRQQSGRRRAGILRGHGRVGPGATRGGRRWRLARSATRGGVTPMSGKNLALARMSDGEQDTALPTGYTGGSWW